MTEIRPVKTVIFSEFGTRFGDEVCIVDELFWMRE
jgi:hypothetical protein